MILLGKLVRNQLRHGPPSMAAQLLSRFVAIVDLEIIPPKARHVATLAAKRIIPVESVRLGVRKRRKSQRMGSTSSSRFDTSFPSESNRTDDYRLELLVFQQISWLKLISSLLQLALGPLLLSILSRRTQALRTPSHSHGLMY